MTLSDDLVLVASTWTIMLNICIEGHFPKVIVHARAHTHTHTHTDPLHCLDHKSGANCGQGERQGHSVTVLHCASMFL